MKLWIFHWPDGTFSLIFARTRIDAFFIADEWDNPGHPHVRVWNIKLGEVRGLAIDSRNGLSQAWWDAMEGVVPDDVRDAIHDAFNSPIVHRQQRDAIVTIN